ncbi:hypothetical protein JCM33374_g1311 [Metschnikowia sp. JCM 33374]|nr:hypothetical protein JCM33374_g1311 [Metschnikowia sp. JCM 33374]
MYYTGFTLISDLLKTYICQKLGIEPSSISETLSTENHVQWTVSEETNPATITATQLSDKKTILNFVNEDSVRAVQINLDAIGVGLPVKVDKITQSLVDSFTAFVDDKLLQQGDFWKITPKKYNNQILENTNKSSAPQLGSPPRSGNDIVSDVPATFSRPPDMPDFEDEYEVNGRGNIASQRGVFSIGERDLNPAGLSRDPPMKPYIDPLAGGIDGGGMYPTGNHPMFGRHQGNTSRLGVPPGARFDDPYGEDNLEDMGMGLPGNLRRPGFGDGFGGPSSGGPPFGGPNFGGPSFGGGMF